MMKDRYSPEAAGALAPLIHDAFSRIDDNTCMELVRTLFNRTQEVGGKRSELASAACQVLAELIVKAPDPETELDSMMFYLWCIIMARMDGHSQPVSGRH